MPLASGIFSNNLGNLVNLVKIKVQTKNNKNKNFFKQ